MAITLRAITEKIKQPLTSFDTFMSPYSQSQRLYLYTKSFLGLQAEPLEGDRVPYLESLLEKHPRIPAFKFGRSLKNSSISKMTFQAFQHQTISNAPCSPCSYPSGHKSVNQTEA